MTEMSGFFNDVDGDREYDAEMFALYFKQFLSNGLYHRNNVPALLVTRGSGLQTKLDTGSAYIEGYLYLNNEEITFTHKSGNSTNPRIDRIVLRLDKNMNSRYIKAFVKEGAPATNPQPPALQRDDIIYEISLAQVRINAGTNVVASVVDERLNPNVAGLVSSLITVPTERFLNDWNEFMAGINNERSTYTQEWMNWMAVMNQQKTDYQQQWDDWFVSRQNDIGIKVVTGADEPEGIASGDIWLKSI